MVMIISLIVSIIYIASVFCTDNINTAHNKKLASQTYVINNKTGTNWGRFNARVFNNTHIVSAKCRYQVVGQKSPVEYIYIIVCICTLLLFIIAGIAFTIQYKLENKSHVNLNTNIIPNYASNNNVVRPSLSLNHNFSMKPPMKLKHQNMPF